MVFREVRCSDIVCCIVQRLSFLKRNESAVCCEIILILMRVVARGCVRAVGNIFEDEILDFLCPKTIIFCDMITALFY